MYIHFVDLYTSSLSTEALWAMSTTIMWDTYPTGYRRWWQNRVWERYQKNLINEVWWYIRIMFLGTMRRLLTSASLDYYGCVQDIKIIKEPVNWCLVMRDLRIMDIIKSGLVYLVQLVPACNDNGRGKYTRRTKDPRHARWWETSASCSMTA